jgi:hypothetical protein
MPHQSSRNTFKASLKQLRKEGKSAKQALTIALKKLGKARGKTKNRDSRKNLIAVLAPRG